MFEINKKIELKANAAYDLVAIGELLIDLISKDYSDNFECDTYIRHFGGSPSNIVINAKKLGLNSIVASSVGEDGFGEFLISKLKQFGVDTRFINKVSYPTSVVIVTKSKGTPVPIFYRGADYNIQLTKELEDAVKNSKILHFSCWPISKRPSRDVVESLLKRAKENDVLISFDPNFHPSLFDDVEEGREYVKEILKQVDIVKPSLDDAERIFGADTEENHIKNFLKFGVKLVMLTLGREGVLISNGKEYIKLPSLAEEVVDTTGAGDAFWSGFYTGIVKGFTIIDSVNLGLKLSALKLKQTGAILECQALDILTF
ncbi:MAG: carbohydrate kinase [Caloramator sp.]|nr:carbohydrate kinase [Caloramator sp.]